MKYYTSTTEFNCGIDLHAHQMYVCVMDRQGKRLVHCNVKDNDFAYFLKLVFPYRHSLTVCAECRHMRERVDLNSPVRENCTPGSVRGRRATGVPTSTANKAKLFVTFAIFCEKLRLWGLAPVSATP